MWEGGAYVREGGGGDWRLCQYTVMEHDLGTQLPVSWNYVYNPEILSLKQCVGRPGRGRG